MLYLDTSAFLKLVVAEEHSAALRHVLESEEIWSSTLLDVEAHRAGQRLGIDAAAIGEYLEIVTLYTLDEGTFARAREVGVSTMRTLDALHLAAALELEPELDGVVTYDRRLAEGCVAENCRVVAPGHPDGWWTAAT